MEKQELLIKFIEWLSEKEDVFYAFDNREKAVKAFLEEQPKFNKNQ